MCFRVPVASVQVLGTDGQYHTLTRTPDNYFEGAGFTYPTSIIVTSATGKLSAHLSQALGIQWQLVLMQMDEPRMLCSTPPCTPLASFHISLLTHAHVQANLSRTPSARAPQAALQARSSSLRMPLWPPRQAPSRPP